MCISDMLSTVAQAHYYHNNVHDQMTTQHLDFWSMCLCCQPDIHLSKFCSRNIFVSEVVTIRAVSPCPRVPIVPRHHASSHPDTGTNTSFCFGAHEENRQ